MARITLRLDDSKAAELRLLAGRDGRSVNAVLTSLVDILLDRATAASRDQELYERLVRAGLIDPREGPASSSAKRPSSRRLAAARSALRGGPVASDVVAGERG